MSSVTFFIILKDYFVNTNHYLTIMCQLLTGEVFQHYYVVLFFTFPIVVFLTA